MDKNKVRKVYSPNPLQSRGVSSENNERLCGEEEEREQSDDGPFNDQASRSNKANLSLSPCLHVILSFHLRAHASLSINLSPSPFTSLAFLGCPGDASAFL